MAKYTPRSAVARNSDFKDPALAAMETISDRTELDQIIARAKNKSAVKRARSIVRDAEERASRDAAEAAAMTTLDLIATSPAVVEPEIETASPPHGDPLVDGLESAGQPAADTPAPETHEQAAERARQQAVADEEVAAERRRESAGRQLRPRGPAARHQ
mgnify:CR=1 FL=1